MPGRSNRRPDGAQPCKQHSDRSLSLMLLGDFRDRGLCGLKAPSQRSSPIWPEIAEFGTARKF
ncbi:hypothetical protein [Lacticaseibacillus paracasei]|uniref:hypothetical protein n=1 Tax=Lacticaseibacillus paracasei TaxID=1597 RepID=UPI00296AA622|nr:hypothetical protein [Lacticaseibacillus paracasei]